MPKNTCLLTIAAMAVFAAGCVQSARGACKCRDTADAVADGSTNDGETSSPICKPPEVEGGEEFSDRPIVDNREQGTAGGGSAPRREPASLFSDAGYLFDASAVSDRDAAGGAATDAGQQPSSDDSASGEGSTGSDEAGAPAIPAPARPGDLVVTEIMADPTAVTDSQGEWFELYNSSEDTSYNLRGCEIADDEGAECVVGADLIVDPLGYVVIARTGQPGFVPGFVCSGLSLVNSAADQVMISCGGTAIDRAQYQGAKAGAALSLDPSRMDAQANDDPSAWCLATASYDGEDLGTPGAPNPACS